MSQAPIWTGVQVFMQSAIASAKTISALTNASPGQVTSAGHGYANNDYFLLTAQGMTEVNNRVFRAAGVATDTLQLAGEDTTNYGVFSAGTIKKLTFGNTFNTFANVSVSGGEPEKIDATTIHDNQKKIRFGMFSALEFSITAQWDLNDAGFQAVIAASKIKAERAFMFKFQSGEIMVFNGNVAASGTPTGGTGKIAETPINITAIGAATYFTS